MFDSTHIEEALAWRHDLHRDREIATTSVAATLGDENGLRADILPNSAELWVRQLHPARRS